MKRVALNYIYLSRKHAGGKDQVGLNLLKGFQENGVAKNMSVICYDYSVETLRSISKDIKIIAIKSPNQKSEMKRMLGNCLTNSFIIPRLLKKNGIDLLYNLDCNNGLFKKRVKSIVIPHDIKAIAHRDLPGLRIPFYKYLLYKIMYAMDFKHADYIIAISDVDKKEIQSFYPKYARKVVRIYNPIDIPLKTEYIVKRSSNIVAINLQFHHKNIITLIRAFEKIKNQINENLVLIGNVPDRVSFLKDYVKEHHLEDRVRFTGFVSDDERNDYLQNCRLYVTPTLFEGFGMVAVEAVISVVPTLVSKIDTNYEVTQGLCNYYDPPESVDSLAEKLLEVLNDEVDGNKLIENANKLYNTYNYLKISRIYYEFFKKI